jgi:hypothetical protein
MSKFQMRLDAAADYRQWLALGQNYELDKFTITPVAFAAGWDACHQRAADPLIAAHAEVGRAMIELTTTVRGQDEWPAIPGLWQCCMETRDAALRELHTTKLQLQELREETKRDGLFAVYWVNLMKMAGHYQDSSDEPVTLHQDDATRTCIITVGRNSITDTCDKRRDYYGSSFEGAIRAAMEAGEADE